MDLPDGELHGPRGQHEDDGRHTDGLGVDDVVEGRPHGGGGPQRQVGGEQAAEEHQLGGEPDDGADVDQRRPVLRGLSGLAGLTGGAAVVLMAS